MNEALLMKRSEHEEKLQKFQKYVQVTKNYRYLPNVFIGSKTGSGGKTGISPSSSSRRMKNKLSRMSSIWLKRPENSNESSTCCGDIEGMMK
jgi:hypothetical protein